MPLFVPIAIGVSTAISAYSAVKAAKASKKAGEAAQRAADSQAELYDWNAQMADLQAKDATARGAYEESRFREGVDLMVGRQRTLQAASNIDVNYGSAVDVQADAAWLGELDALTIRTNAARAAWGFEVQGQDLRKRAVITRREGANLAEAGRVNATAQYVSAAGSVVGGVSLLAQRYGFSSPTTAPQPTLSPSASYQGSPIMPAVYGN